ncbi:carboxypeptidase-like regulatory domain-containing protein [Echinicola sp. CAU 1574]|uniref:Carboxypeptidase-like regulatory domain-containing protein n=1 Tax=Echinicola arenosa TaxID=2774144 RepID=A0ABR9API3_9BACT|nr:DUF5686 and carboxypeptidase regulatory-like domain-containing protein [Echinicola arenosa]MBD8490236.1 carboxypeptidase-like regulatory domain-containing protein [Echinicola arenosa]
MSKDLLRVIILVFFHFFMSVGLIEAQGIRGRVLSRDGDPLAYASVFIRNINDGIPTNQDGDFEYPLASGYYDIIVQHLGYKSVQKTVQINSGWVELKIELEPQMYALEEVEIKGGAEDPALTVMRKAISKAKFHRLQVEEYSMRVYIKGTGELTDAPFFLKKKLKEEGIALNEAYTSESVSEITFKQPNEINERVISIRTNGENNQTSPAPYIGASFYADKVNEVISPLSKSAFAYYRFKHEGTFFENGVLINKIRVTPRSRGEQVFEGHIYIIEDLWAIHSLKLKTSIMGFDVGVTQQYAPVEENVWMPLTHIYTFGGKFFGFEGNYKYLASTRDYQIKLNPDLVVETEILDEKVDDIPEQITGFDHKESAVKQIADAEQMSRKDFRKMINEYEKESLKERKDAEVVAMRNYSVDSLAKERNQSYWDSIRPVKLTEKEILGYERDDSLAVVEAAKKSDVDSIANKAKRKFNPLDIIGGGRYHFGNGRSAGFSTNWTKISFNTVEGFKLGFSGFYRKVSKDSISGQENSWRIKPEIRYGFSSNKLYGMVDFSKSWSRDRTKLTYGISGGNYIYQYNASNPISEQVNALYSLFFRQNYMKLFNQKFVKIYLSHIPHDAFTYSLSLSYEDRGVLQNQSNYSFYNKPERTYTSNIPNNEEALASSFESNEALIADVSVNWRPGLKYYVRNGKKYPLYGGAPLISFLYRKGIPNAGLMGNAADFDQLELGIKHDFQFGVSGKLDFNIKAGAFLNDGQVYFMDFKHFGGNRTIFSNMGTVNNYRFLDYYQYSTRGNYISGIVHYQFRKFLFTQLPMLRFSGIRENVFFNYLKTEYSPHYWEVGYSLDNLFRVFRVEMGAGFEGGEYLRGGVRLGIATFINISMDD